MPLLGVGRTAGFLDFAGRLPPPPSLSVLPNGIPVNGNVDRRFGELARTLESVFSEEFPGVFDEADEDHNR